MDITTEEKDAILATIFGGLTLKEMTGMTFYKWVIRQLDNQPLSDKRVSAMVARVSGLPPRLLPDDEKIDIFLKLKEIGII